MFYVKYLTRESTAQSVCSPGAGFNPPEFLSPYALPGCVVLSRYVSSLVARGEHLIEHLGPKRLSWSRPSFEDSG